MKELFINYYGEFNCIAEKCNHNCCIYWQIQIDKKSIRQYRKNAELRKTIDFVNRRFLLINGRCANLDSDNLCKILKANGKLCQICSDHPRYRNYIKNYVETGLGLSCEEACRIILSKEERPYFTKEDVAKKLKGFEKEKYLFREKLLDIIFNDKKELNEKIKEICDIIGFNQYDKPLEFYANFIEKLNRLEDGFYKKLEKLKNPEKPIKNYKEYTQILAYFICRHLLGAVDLRDLYSRTAFSILSLRIINGMLGEELEIKNLIEVCRSYSTEIEYDEENLNAFWDLTDGLVTI